MNDETLKDLDSYLASAGSWSEDRARMENRSRRLAWIVAGCASVIAVCEALALAALAPLKTVEPYTLLVDRQTGYIEALKPTERGAVTPDTALIRSMLVQYVIARESFDIDSLQNDYRKVSLWTAGQERQRYVAGMQASNPASPLASLPRRALVETQIRSVSALSADSALVRFATVRTDPGGQRQDAQLWAAVIKYRFADGPMSAEDRFINPLGFQVVRYRRDAEIPPPPQVVQVAAPPGSPTSPVAVMPVVRRPEQRP